MEWLQQIIDLINNVGFPIAVTCYLLYRDTTVITELTKSINENTLALTKLGEKLSEGGE